MSFKLGNQAANGRSPKYSVNPNRNVAPLPAKPRQGEGRKLVADLRVRAAEGDTDAMFGPPAL